jgi:hypothetical protein
MLGSPNFGQATGQPASASFQVCSSDSTTWGNHGGQAFSICCNNAHLEPSRSGVQPALCQLGCGGYVRMFFERGRCCCADLRYYQPSCRHENRPDRQRGPQCGLLHRFRLGHIATLPSSAQQESLHAAQGFTGRRLGDSRGGDLDCSFSNDGTAEQVFRKCGGGEEFTSVTQARYLRINQYNQLWIWHFVSSVQCLSLRC